MTSHRLIAASATQFRILVRFEILARLQQRTQLSIGSWTEWVTSFGAPIVNETRAGQQEQPPPPANLL